MTARTLETPAWFTGEEEGVAAMPPLPSEEITLAFARTARTFDALRLFYTVKNTVTCFRLAPIHGDRHREAFC